MEDSKNTISKYPLWILIAIGYSLFFYSLFNDFVGDDFDQLVRNTFIQNPAHIPYFFLGGTFNNGFVNLSGIYYKPLMTIMFSLLYVLFKATPFVYHFSQVSLHIANAILIYVLFKKFFPKLLSWSGAVLFLVHPINTEAVVYISNLQDVLFTFFGLFGLVLTIYKQPTTKTLCVIYTLLLLSLLSKETGVLFLAITLVYQYIYVHKQRVLHILFSAGTLLLYTILRVHAVGLYSYHTENFPMMQLSLAKRLVQIPAIITYYLKTFFIPYPLAFAQNWVVKTISFPLFIFPLLLILILLGGIGFLIYKNRNNTNHFKQLIFFTSWILIGLILHLQILPLDMTVADRWFYFPAIGLIGLLGTIYIQYAKNIKKQSVNIYIFSCIICLFFVLTFLRSLNWQNQYALYEHDVKYNKDSFSLLNGYASELMNLGKYNEAEPYIRRSIALEPNFCYSWNNLGSVYAQKKDYQHARTYYEEAIKRRDCVLAYNNLGTLMSYHFPPDDAYIYLTDAMKKVPNSPRLWLMLALVEEKRHNHEKAIAAAKKSYQLDRSTASTYVLENLLKNNPIELRDQ